MSKFKIKDRLITNKMCQRDDCKLCEKLNELGENLETRGYLTNKIMDKLGPCFYH